MSSRLYNKFITSIEDGMYRYALSIVREPDDAKDVVQDCLVKIWSIRHELATIEKVHAWAFRIVRNKCIERLRNKRYTHLSNRVADLQLSEPADQQTIYQDQLLWLNEVLRTLPPKQREIFHLREVEEMSYKEIADTCGLTESNVKVSIHRVRKRIKETMQKIEAHGVVH